MMKTCGNKTIDREPKGPFGKKRSSGGLPIVMRDNTLEKRATPKASGDVNYSGNDVMSPKKGY